MLIDNFKLHKINIPQKPKNEQGIALILVLWVIVMLTAIVGEFAFSMRTELNIARNFKEEEAAYQLALAGIEYAKVEILSAKEPPYPYFNKNGILVFTKEQSEEDPKREVRLKSGMFSYTIIDEDGKLNINTASLEQLRHVIASSGIDTIDVDAITDSILDWGDTDNLHRLNGAEEDYYRSLPKPYSCKDGPIEVIEEMLLIKGMDQKIFFGSPDETGQAKHDGLNRHFAVRDSNNININTASRVVLESVFGDNVAENIIGQRESGPILSPIGSSIVKSTIFAIISTGTNSDGTIKRTIKTIVKRDAERQRLVPLYWNDNWIERQNLGLVQEKNV